MREQTPAAFAVWAVFTASEDDVIAEGVGAGVDSTGGLASCCIGVNTDVAEVDSKAGFEKAAGALVKRSAAGIYNIPDVGAAVSIWTTVSWIRRRRGCGKSLLAQHSVRHILLFFAFSTFGVELIRFGRRMIYTYRLCFPNWHPHDFIRYRVRFNLCGIVWLGNTEIIRLSLTGWAPAPAGAVSLSLNYKHG